MFSKNSQIQSYLERIGFEGSTRWQRKDTG